MPLEETDLIDIITISKEGRLRLVITDSGQTTDPHRRLELLEKKAKTYASYLHGDSFASKYPGKTAADCDIVLMARMPPTQAMQALTVQGLSLLFEQFAPEAAAVERTEARTEETGRNSPPIMLFEASSKNDLNLMKDAVTRGARVNAPDPLGHYPIEYAVRNGNIEMLKFLLASGARFPEDSIEGRTLWVSAHARRNTEMEEVLVSQGVKPTFTDRVLAFILRLKLPRR